MRLDSDKFKSDESLSNPMVVAMCYDDCPIKDVCVYVAQGFGSIVKQCQYFEDRADAAYCKYDDIDKVPDRE